MDSKIHTIMRVMRDYERNSLNNQKLNSHHLIIKKVTIYTNYKVNTIFPPHALNNQRFANT